MSVTAAWPWPVGLQPRRAEKLCRDAWPWGVLSAIQPYTQMVGFRNLVVHRYDSLDCALVVEIVNERLGDFERFRDEVLAYASEL